MITEKTLNNMSEVIDFKKPGEMVHLFVEDYIDLYKAVIDMRSALTLIVQTDKKELESMTTDDLINAITYDVNEAKITLKEHFETRI